MNRTDARLSAQLMAIDIISQLLVSAAPETLGEQLTDQLRELTGAKTIVLMVYDQDLDQPVILSVSPKRRSTIFSAEELDCFCAGSPHDNLPLLVENFPDGLPGKAALSRAGVTAAARYHLIAGHETVGTLLLLDPPEIDRIEESDAIIHLLSPPIALALKNALAYRKIKRQANELESLVEERTMELLRKNAELQRAENLSRTILQSAREGFWLVDSRLRIVDVNDAYCTMSGFSRQELIGARIEDLDACDSKEEVAARANKLIESGSDRFESEHRRKDGSRFPVAVSVSYVPIDDGLYSVFINDITQRQRAEEALRHSEEQLRQSQKMEAVGQLAGGVAHDFNNILQVIEGYCSLLQTDRTLNQDQQAKVAEVIASAERAAQLTRGLLAYSRKQAMIMKREDLIEVIQQVHRFLSRIIGEDITFHSESVASELPVHADRGQIEQVLINLATNARDAMPSGGVFSVRSERVVLDDCFVDFHQHNVQPGTYALLTVSDTGAGIKKEHLEHIFEPFFTTKEVGKGTGLGMAIVYGIVKQHNGFINVYSEPGEGTTYRIYLPILDAGGNPLVEKSEVVSPQRGSETILVAEDDPAVRALVSQILTSYGYETILAENGEDAVEKFAAHQDRIRMVLMDVVMPKKNGREAFEEIKRLSPGTKALFSSGYTADFIENRGVSEEGIELVMKPIHPMELLRKIREMLDA
ncbi:ATP-binding protein [Geomesophilobacter sediminis]|uniref:histidine kinase n=1 Tax=Geomesophilobacter sediminis TaxID=2798584 RepID=A0A8J7JN12_9BACT|nr:ATP-binding protein [Geomesophilobacter sediminis]MBJ6726350.1 PAS domain S-box protein [Geomesophilobacter sediminis]